MKTTRCYAVNTKTLAPVLDNYHGIYKNDGSYTARIVKERDWRKLLALVRDVAKFPCTVGCGTCISCRARAILKPRKK